MSSRSLEDDFNEPQQAQEFDDKSELFVGSVYELLNKKHWRFGDDDGSGHPGACYEFDSSARQVNIVKGTSQHPGSRLPSYVEVECSDENGLGTTTYFSLNQLFSFRSRIIELLHHDRRRGELSTLDLERIQLGLSEFTREDE